MSNIYYNPSDYGLEVVASIEYDADSYSFDTRVIWRDKKGRLWTARDSGCSCPTPFENHNLTTIERLNKKEIIKEVTDRLNAGAHEFIKKVKSL